MPADGGVTGPGIQSLLGGFTYSGNGAANPAIPDVLAARPYCRPTIRYPPLCPPLGYRRYWSPARYQLHPWRRVRLTGTVPEDRPSLVLGGGSDQQAYYVSYNSPPRRPSSTSWPRSRPSEERIPAACTCMRSRTRCHPRAIFPRIARLWSARPTAPPPLSRRAPFLTNARAATCSSGIFLPLFPIPCGGNRASLHCAPDPQSPIPDSPMSPRRPLLPLLFLLAGLRIAAAAPDAVVVFNEIHYNPPGPDGRR